VSIIVLNWLVGEVQCNAHYSTCKVVEAKKQLAQISCGGGGGNYAVVHNASGKEDTIILHRVIFNRMSNLKNSI
jgi:hypothetical protein